MMGILKNTTDGIYPMHPYQQAMLNKISGGFKHGEMMILSAGRQTGKSMLNYYYGKLRNNNLCNEILLPMKPEPKYKFSRAKWYEAEYDWIHYGEVCEWCTQQFGPHPKQQDAWSRWDHRYEGRIYFRDAKDYEWFVLRWS